MELNWRSYQMSQILYWFRCMTNTSVTVERYGLDESGLIITDSRRSWLTSTQEIIGGLLSI